MLLGQVENMVVDLSTGDVPYAFLLFGRDPATANLFYAVPFAAMDLNRQGQGFILRGNLKDYQSEQPYNRQALANGALLPDDFRPVAASGNAASPVIATPELGVTPIPTVGVLKGPLVLLPQLIGWQVWNSAGQRTGVVQDFPIDAHTRQVTYAIVALGNASSASKRLVPVPLRLLQLNAGSQAFVLRVDQSTLQKAPSFTPDARPNTAQPGWDAQAAAFWRKQAP
jgi:sporulation protein YlmC with PRC-barrel domain